MFPSVCVFVMAAGLRVEQEERRRRKARSRALSSRRSPGLLEVVASAVVLEVAVVYW
mgnify:CR=1 FL=1